MTLNTPHGTKRGSGYRILFYVERDLHLPFLEPIHDWLKANSACELAFGVPPFRESRENAPGVGLKRDELERLAAKGRLVESAEAFRPHATICADACTGLKHCGKLVFVGHGIISKGGFYTSGQIVRRENLADLICVPGPLHKEILEKNVFSPISVTGFIKSDRMFAPGVPTRDSARRHYGIPADARVVLFAPTFNPEMSSLYVIGERVAELCADGVYLMVKLHTMTDIAWKEKFRTLAADCGQMLFCEEIDATPAMLAADVLVTDVSSVMAEFMFLDRPVIVVDNPRLTEYAHYVADDIEYRVRDSATVRVATVEELKRAVNRSLDAPGEFSHQRRVMTEALCHGRDGRAAERASLAVLDLLELPAAGARLSCTVVFTWPFAPPLHAAQDLERKLAGENPGVALRCLHSGLPDPSPMLARTTFPAYSPAWVSEVARLAEGELIVMLRPGLQLPEGWLKRLSHYFRWDGDTAWIQPFSHRDDLRLLAGVIGQLLPGQEAFSYREVAQSLSSALIGHDVPLVVPDNLCVMFKRRSFEMLRDLPASDPSDFPLLAVRAVIERGGKVRQAPDILTYPEEMADKDVFMEGSGDRAAHPQEANDSPAQGALPPIVEEQEDPACALSGADQTRRTPFADLGECSTYQHHYDWRQPMQNNDPRYEILKDSYRELQSQMETQFLHTAVERVELFLKYEPGHALAHNDLGVLYYRKGDKLQALGHFQKANRFAPDNPAFQKTLAKFYVDEMGWADEAFDLFQKVLQATPDDIEALLALSTLSSGAGKSVEARAFMERILALQGGSPAAHQPAPPAEQAPRQEPKPWSSPGVTLRETAPQVRKSADDLYLEARDCAEKGNAAGAVLLLEELLAGDPRHSLAHNDLGVLYLSSGDTAAALEHHKSACALEPDNGVFAGNLAGLYLDLGMTDDAIFALSDRLKRHPNDVETLTGLGNISLSLDRVDEAKIFFEKVLVLEPWNQTARETVAALRTPAAQLPTPQPSPAQRQAVPAAAAPPAGQESASLEQLLAKLRSSVAAGASKESAQTMYSAAQQSVQAGRLDEATDRLEALIASYPAFAPAHNDLGVLYYQQGDPGRALARHRQAVSLAPDDLNFKKNLAGLCLADDATLDEAILLLTQIVKSHPSDIETLFALGRVCRDQNRPEEAKIFLRRLLEYEPWHREAQDLLKQVSQAAL